MDILIRFGLMIVVFSLAAALYDFLRKRFKKPPVSDTGEPDFQRPD